MYCLEKFAQLHLTPTFLQKIPLLIDFEELFLLKFTADNLILFIFQCVCWRFSGRNCMIFRNFLCKLWLKILRERSVILGDANFISTFKLGFLYARSGLLYRIDKKSEFLIFSVNKSIKHFSSGIQRYDQLRQFVNVVVSTTFQVTVFLFQGSFCTLSKCSLGLTHFRVNG